jgi:hypothetical protein
LTPDLIEATKKKLSPKEAKAASKAAHKKSKKPTNDALFLMKMISVMNSSEFAFILIQILSQIWRGKNPTQ